MKILLVHSFYGSCNPSGENIAYLAERELLLAGGHTVSEYTASSDTLLAKGVFGMLQAGLLVPWNPFTFQGMRSAIRQHRPDVVHVHNVFPMLSPSIFYAARRAGIPVVVTVHNHRLYCLGGVAMYAGEPCFKCLDSGFVGAGVLRGCYKGSKLASIPVGSMIELHRRLRSWERCVDAFVALTDYQRQLLVKAGLPAARIHVKPNGFPDRPVVRPIEKRENVALCVGRISPEKGVEDLVDAWRSWGTAAPPLRIIGSGPSQAAIAELAERHKLNVSFLGQMSLEDVQLQMRRARLVILPTRCIEGFPMVIREAFANGVPVAASRLGAIPEIVRHGANGLLFEPGNGTDLFLVISRIWNKEGELERLAKGAYASFEQQYSHVANLAKLISVYEYAVRRCRDRADD